MAALQRDPALDLIYADARLLIGDFETSETFMDASPSSGSVSFESLLREDCTVPTSCAVVRRKVVFQAGLFDESLLRCEDLDLWLRIAHQGARMSFQRRVLAYHRKCNGLAADTQRMVDARLSVYRRLLVNLQLSPLQQSLAGAQIEKYEAKLRIEHSKAHLLSGNYPEAFAAMQSANAYLKQRKLKWGVLAIRLLPWLVRFLYPRYRRVLELVRRQLICPRAGTGINARATRESHHGAAAD
jgi:hypothetical protein